MKKLICVIVAGLVIAGNASAGIIGSLSSCNTTHVNATGYGDSDMCIGLLKKSSGSGNPFDSESFLNTAQNFSDGRADPLIWNADGAFGHNDWMFLGKDDQSTQTFIDVTSGNPFATWSVDAALNGTFTIAIKQGRYIGYWYFDDLAGVTAGQLFINDIFGSGFGNNGWSHVSIYQTASSVPEPSVIALLGAGLFGLGLACRRRHK